MKLLGEIEAGSAFIEQFDDATKMAFSPLRLRYNPPALGR
jgi:hypothetical protein